MNGAGSVRFRFHGFLQTLLRCAHKQGLLDYPVGESPAVKDAIEACGVPHTEVDLIAISGRCVNFTHRLQPGEELHVYPYDLLTPDVSGILLHLSSLPEFPGAFILDVHLGKLARRLRLLGFDCLYRNDLDDVEIIETALTERRTILTRDRGILKHSCVCNGLLIRHNRVEKQVVEVLQRYRLHASISPLSRCPLCNGCLTIVDKSRIAHLLAEKTYRFYSDFKQCECCGKVYWPGAHYENIACWIAGLKKVNSRK
ncbi:MAG: twitching motility protein PilT [Desulfuromonas sp.]|nr:MAG: twitching motility protein PilT [Desulfuromonas sp.]